MRLTTTERVFRGNLRKSGPGAGRLFASLLGLALGLGRPHSLAAQPAQAVIGTGQVSEVVLSETDAVPALGAMQPLVTIDTFLALSGSSATTLMPAIVALVQHSPDVRLRFHVVVGKEDQGRGAELALAGFAQAGPRVFPLLLEVMTHPQWLAQTGQTESNLWTAARRHGLDVGRLQQDLLRHRYLGLANEQWQALHTDLRRNELVLLNGQRLRLPATPGQLRQEIDHHRQRAYHALSSGVPPSRIYAHFLSEQAKVNLSGRGDFRTWQPPISSLSASIPGTQRRALHLEEVMLPVRGPEVSSVTMVVVANLESKEGADLARLAQNAWHAQKESVRWMVVPFVPLNRPSFASRGPRILWALAWQDPPTYWRIVDQILDLMKGRYVLNYYQFTELLRREHVDLGHLEAQLDKPALRARTEQVGQILSAQGMTGPVLLINDRPHTLRPKSPEEMSRLLDTERSLGLLDKWRRRTP